MKRICARGVLLMLLLYTAVRASFLLGSPPELAFAQGTTTLITWNIPVIINIYPNAGITERQARDAVRAASDIFAQAGVSLVPVSVNQIGPNSGGTGSFGGDDGSGGGTAGDGDFTSGEFARIRTFGGRELKDLPNEKGIKIAFGRNPDDDDHRNPGISYGRNPTILVRNRGAAAGPQGTGATIAHEVGHVLGLNWGLHESDPNNFMASSAKPRTGTNMTPEQIDKMTGRHGFLGLGGREIADYGKCASQFRENFPVSTLARTSGPATKCALQFGATTNPGPVTSILARVSQIDQVFLTGWHESDQSGGDTQNIYARISVPGLLRPGDNVDMMYALGFDTDANPDTGIPYGGYRGIDRIVYVVAHGKPETGSVNLTGMLLDPVEGRLISLPVPSAFSIEDKAGDLGVPSVPMGTSFLLSIPKGLLGLSEAKIPVVACAGHMGNPALASDDNLTDCTHDLFFDPLRFAHDPTLQPAGTGVPTPGQAYSFRLSGLAPNDNFALLLDGTPVLTGALDGTGSFEGAFVFPTTRFPSEPHSLVAQDSTGEFAYSMTCPEPGVTLQVPIQQATLSHEVENQLLFNLPSATAQYQLQVAPLNDDGPAINLIISDMAMVNSGVFPLRQPEFGTGNYVLLAGAHYRWRVRSTEKTTAITEFDESWGQWSTARDFILSPPSSSTISLQSLTTESVTKTPTLRWSNSDGHVFYYEVQLSGEPSFDTNPATARSFVYWNLVHGGQAIPLSSWTVPSAFALPSGTYYWRVRPRVQATPLGVAEPGVAWMSAASFTIR